jgi:hypothetical protein
MYTSNAFTAVKGGFPLVTRTVFPSVLFLLWPDDGSYDPKLVAKKMLERHGTCRFPTITTASVAGAKISVSHFLTIV